MRDAAVGAITVRLPSTAAGDHETGGAGAEPGTSHASRCGISRLARVRLGNGASAVRGAPLSV